jgi:hypothetical protein
VADIEVIPTSAVQRPDCFEFAMSFLGDPEETVLRQYIADLEARAALAQPEPVGPTAAELRNLWSVCNSPSVFARAVLARWGRPAIQPVPAPMSADTLAAIIREVDGSHDKGAAALAEAILAHPAARNAHPRTALAQPEPEEPVKYNKDFWRKDALEKLVYAATAFRLGIYSAEELEIAENRARFFLARWGRPAIQPVPVSERPWEREGWCDAEGRCYAWDGYWWLVGNLESAQNAGEGFTHSLPHYALPIPTSQEVLGDA